MHNEYGAANGRIPPGAAETLPNTRQREDFQ